MDISSPSVGAYFTGAPHTEKLFKVQSRKKGKKNAIAAKLAEHWLNDLKNRSTIWNLWCQSVRDGMGIGMSTVTGSLFPVTSSKFFADPATGKRQTKKMKGEDNAKRNK